MSFPKRALEQASQYSSIDEEYQRALQQAFQRTGIKLKDNQKSLPLIDRLQPISQGASFPDDKESMQDRNMEYTSSTNQPYSEDLASQASETEVDAELSLIADQLRETSSYAINPIFKEELRKKLLQQFVAHHTTETKPIQDMDAILCAQLPIVATDIAKLPTKERSALLSDLGKPLLPWAYRYIIHPLKRFHGQSTKKLHAFLS